MIGKLTGSFGGMTPDGAALIEVGGVGYAVRVPALALADIKPSTLLGASNKISLFVHTAVRDDAIDLYGFPTQEELAFFTLLIGVSGIGPKSALAILSVADVATLRRAIAGGDSSVLHKVFGIGKKSAERIVVELRDKLAGEIGSSGAASPGATSDEIEVIEALIALGYSAYESRSALKAIAKEEYKTPRERIGAALRQLGNV